VIIKTSIEGALMFDTKNISTQTIICQKRGQKNIYRNIIQTFDNRILICTEEGIFEFNIKTNIFKH